ncbi:hypothetical protein BSZ21_07680 [Bradyrhizobium canariense]|nr:hypothetical protein BSZ21_07680 [Bradyrhizobium canariense]
MLMVHGRAGGDPDIPGVRDVRAAEAGGIRDCSDHGWMQNSRRPGCAVAYVRNRLTESAAGSVEDGVVAKGVEVLATV